MKKKETSPHDFFERLIETTYAEEIEERAAIMEYDAKQSRYDAELFAAILIAKKYGIARR